MKRFQFTLEPLQTLRQRQEQAAQQRYGHAVTARQEAIEHLRQARTDWEQVCRTRARLLASGISAGELAGAQAFGRVMEERVAAGEAGVVAAQRVVEQRWQELLLARQALEVLEKYKQRQQDRYNRQRDRNDQKMLDDMVLQRGNLAGQALNTGEGRS